MADQSFAENPWSAEFWNLTRQGEYIKKYGLEVAKTKAKQAGTKLGAPMLRVINPPNFTVVVQRRDLTVSGGGGGSIIGAGSSGDGPPS